MVAPEDLVEWPAKIDHLELESPESPLYQKVAVSRVGTVLHVSGCVTVIMECQYTERSDARVDGDKW